MSKDNRIKSESIIEQVASLDSRHGKLSLTGQLLVSLVFAPRLVYYIIVC